ncbi:hypothetical protein [Aureliella helgolandensis]|uniref:Lipoprotein n=1 Tax=Aureliella helgolandensis TaxID=2527968 RepID=A0A518G3P8_9BACT|nr:hypothetical protein [Aureliella helgolandensis]QDV23212.1 hypothetical protein Q31a_15100 [Aureliella helgolandensis]
MFYRSIRGCCVLSMSLIVGFVGCQGQRDATPNQGEYEHGESQGHEVSSEEHAENFRELVQDIEAMTTEICQAFVDGSPEDVHDTLHGVGHSLEKLPELAAKEGKLSPEQMTAVNEAVEALFDGFGKLDNTLHGGEDVDIQAIEAQLVKNLKKIKEVSK